MPTEIQQQAAAALQELLLAANIERGGLLVLGCSTSEVLGQTLGTASSPQVAEQLLGGMLPLLHKAGVYLAVQCCEHLNRALVVERDALQKYGLTEVNALPQPKAGGSAATCAWQLFRRPALAESLRGQAAAGLDVGGTLIGMHLREVAVPLRLQNRTIGAAAATAARTRPKFVGGSRAVYNPALL
ncbi:MAG: TIGR01440 family protein [Oscillospiraceae bacterium]